MAPAASLFQGSVQVLLLTGQSLPREQGKAGAEENKLEWTLLKAEAHSQSMFTGFVSTKRKELRNSVRKEKTQQFKEGRNRDRHPGPQ